MKLSDLEIVFKLWLEDYTIFKWEGLDSSEKDCLQEYHWQNFLKELRGTKENPNDARTD